MSRASASERLRRHLYAAVDAFVELTLCEGGAATIADAPPAARRTVGAEKIQASDTDRAFAEKTLKAAGWGSKR